MMMESIAGWFQALLDRWYWKDIFLSAIVTLSFWLASWTYLQLVDRIVRRWALRTASRLDDALIDLFRRPVALLIFLTGVYSVVHRYTFGLRDALDGLIFVISVALVIYTAIRFVLLLLRWYAERIGQGRQRETVVGELLPLADKVVKVVLSAIGLVIVLDRFHIEIRSILVTLGVGGLAVGLALQDTLANIFGGFTIILDGPFRVGDRIQLQTGELGEVQSIGMRSTKVLMLEGNLLIVPNSLLVKTMVINHSQPDKRFRLVFELGIAYGSDTEKAKSLMLEAAGANSKVLQNPSPAAFFKRFGDSGPAILMYCFVADFCDIWIVTDSINSAIDARFRAAGIDIPFPTRSLYLKETDQWRDRASPSERGEPARG